MDKKTKQSINEFHLSKEKLFFSFLLLSAPSEKDGSQHLPPVQATTIMNKIKPLDLYNILSPLKQESIFLFVHKFDTLSAIQFQNTILNCQQKCLFQGGSILGGRRCYIFRYNLSGKHINSVPLATRDLFFFSLFVYKVYFSQWELLTAEMGLMLRRRTKFHFDNKKKSLIKGKRYEPI